MENQDALEPVLKDFDNRMVLVSRHHRDLRPWIQEIDVEQSIVRHLGPRESDKALGA